MMKTENNQSICFPEYVGQDFNVRHIFGKCRCGNNVVSYEQYCHQCGMKLDWTVLREELNEKGFKF